MKRLFLCFVLAIAGIQAKLCAQESDCAVCPMRFKTQTDNNFNATWVNNRHIVHLKKGEKMIVEMLDLKDYDQLGNIDSLLMATWNDLKPLKDSMQTAPSGNLRIDYVAGTNKDFKKIRIQKYNAYGDIYVLKQGDVSNLKTEQDTVRILIHKFKENLYRKYEPVQVTLILNNYSDMEKLASLNPGLQHFIDTMRAVSLQGEGKQNAYTYQTSIFFNPDLVTNDHYSTRFKMVKGAVLKNEYGHNGLRADLPRLDMNLYLGTGLIRNQFSPTADIGLDYVFAGTRNTDYQTFLGIYAGPYFSFTNKGDGAYNTYYNWFVNAELGSNTKGQELHSNFKSHFLRASLGIGYLVNPDNVIFHGTTMKAFFNYTFRNCICISPELLCTDNFQSVFPAVTIKYYLNSFMDN